MGRAPAYVFVVRHGNRLDQANKRWHLQSPTPYDTPLTYSGWAQAKAVGRRIGDILRERQAQDDAAAIVSDSTPRKRRKFDIVLHSSPFLRCVQTSVGISAGLAVQPTASKGFPSQDSAEAYDSQASSLVLDPDSETGNSLPPLTTGQPEEYDAPIRKTVLRLDSFLGEWLTPSYFETITPPPGSGLMLAGAKAELLRRSSYDSYTHLKVFPQAKRDLTDHTWTPLPLTAGPVVSSSQRLASWGLENVSSMAAALPRRNSVSTASDISLGDDPAYGGGYIAPKPLYAVGHGADIPKGLFMHARDHCCHIDYQWDTSRGSQDWGDGGHLGEEWPEMHKRFRAGMQKMIDWYCTAEAPTKMVTKTRANAFYSRALNEQIDTVDEEDNDMETEAVIVIVTHGAGCNALVGAISQKPVLYDFGLASLTEAERKPEKDEVMEHSLSLIPPSQNGRSQLNHTKHVALDDLYDLKLIGATDHLHTRSTRASLAAAAAASRGRHASIGSLSPAFNAGSLIDGSSSRSCSAAANLLGARRDSGASSAFPGRLGINTNIGNGITVGSGATSFRRANQATNSPRLWSPLRPRMSQVADEDEDEDFLPDFSSLDSPARDAFDAKDVASQPDTNKVSEISNEDTAKNLTPRTIVTPETTKGGSQTSASSSGDETDKPLIPPTQFGLGVGGLWGSPRLEATDRVRHTEDIVAFTTSKRRWTVNHRS